MKKLTVLFMGHPELRRQRGTSQIRVAIAWFDPRCHESRAASRLVSVIFPVIARFLASLGMTRVKMG